MQLPAASLVKTVNTPSPVFGQPDKVVTGNTSGREPNKPFTPDRGMTSGMGVGMATVWGGGRVNSFDPYRYRLPARNVDHDGKVMIFPAKIVQVGGDVGIGRKWR